MPDVSHLYLGRPFQPPAAEAPEAATAGGAPGGALSSSSTSGAGWSPKQTKKQNNANPAPLVSGFTALNGHGTDCSRMWRSVKATWQTLQPDYITGRGISNVSLPIVRLLPGGPDPAVGTRSPTQPLTWDHCDAPLDEIGIGIGVDEVAKLAINPIIVQLDRIMHAWRESEDDGNKHRLDQKSIRYLLKHSHLIQLSVLTSMVALRVVTDEFRILCAHADDDALKQRSFAARKTLVDAGAAKILVHILNTVTETSEPPAMPRGAGAALKNQSRSTFHDPQLKNRSLLSDADWALFTFIVKNGQQGKNYDMDRSLQEAMIQDHATTGMAGTALRLISYLLQDPEDPMTLTFGAQLLAEQADLLLYRLSLPQSIATLKPAVPFALAALSKLAWPSLHTREVASAVTMTACEAALLALHDHDQYARSEAAQLLSNNAASFKLKQMVLEPKSYAALIALLKDTDFTERTQGSYFGRTIAAVGNVSYMSKSWPAVKPFAEFLLDVALQEPRPGWLTENGDEDANLAAINNARCAVFALNQLQLQAEAHEYFLGRRADRLIARRSQLCRTALGVFDRFAMAPPAGSPPGPTPPVTPELVKQLKDLLELYDAVETNLVNPGHPGGGDRPSFRQQHAGMQAHSEALDRQLHQQRQVETPNVPPVTPLLFPGEPGY